MEFKAVITNVSEVDSGLSFIVTYDVYVDGVLKFQNHQISGNDKTTIRQLIKDKLQEVKSVENEQNKFQVGEEITLG